MRAERGRKLAVQPFKPVPILLAVRAAHHINFRPHITEGEYEGESVKNSFQHTQVDGERVKNLRDKVCHVSPMLLFEARNRV